MRSKSFIPFVAVGALALCGLGISTAQAAGTDSAGEVVYSSLGTAPGDVSQPYAAERTTEFGDGVTLSKSGGTLQSVTVRMSSYSCETGAWNNTDCVTTDGAAWTQPLTLTLYGVNADGTLGAPLAHKTTDFQIPYRPSATTDTSLCTKAGQWYDDTTHACYFNRTTNETFTGFDSVVLPDKLVVTIGFPTGSTGGTAGPADSLNFAVTADAPAVGQDTAQDAWIDTQAAHYYTPEVAAGSGLRESVSESDWEASPGVWYVPQVEIRVASEPESTPSSTPSHSTTPFVPTGSELTTGNGHGFTVTGDVFAGGTVTIDGGAAAAGRTGEAFVFSTPVSLGTVTFDAAGKATVVLPADLATGAHRIAVYAADGTVLGWAAVAVDPTLAATGSNAGPIAAFAVVLLLAGAVLFAVSRRNLTPGR